LSDEVKGVHGLREEVKAELKTEHKDEVKEVLRAYVLSDFPSVLELHERGTYALGCLGIPQTSGDSHPRNTSTGPTSQRGYNFEKTFSKSFRPNRMTK